MKINEDAPEFVSMHKLTMYTVTTNFASFKPIKTLSN